MAEFASFTDDHNMVSLLKTDGGRNYFLNRDGEWQEYAENEIIEPLKIDARP